MSFEQYSNSVANSVDLHNPISLMDEADFVSETSVDKHSACKLSRSINLIFFKKSLTGRKFQLPIVDLSEISFF